MRHAQLWITVYTLTSRWSGDVGLERSDLVAQGWFFRSSKADKLLVIDA